MRTGDVHFICSLWIRKVVEKCPSLKGTEIKRVRNEKHRNQKWLISIPRQAEFYLPSATTLCQQTCQSDQGYTTNGELFGTCHRNELLKDSCQQNRSSRCFALPLLFTLISLFGIRKSETWYEKKKKLMTLYSCHNATAILTNSHINTMMMARCDYRGL